MSVFQGDFLGFTLGETHSSQLNITRVSSGDRYEDILKSIKGLSAAYKQLTLDEEEYL